MGVGVTGGLNDARGAILIHAEKTVRSAAALHGVDGGLDAAVRAILKSDGHGKAAGHLAVGLRLGGAGADGGPANEVGKVLRSDGVERLGGCGQAEGIDIEKEFAREGDAVREVATVVEVRVVDEALPADGRARFLEIDAHDDGKTVADFLAELHEFLSVLHSRDGVVDRAGANDDEEAIVLSTDDGVGFLASLPDGLKVLRCRGILFLDLCRRDEPGDTADAHVLQRENLPCVFMRWIGCDGCHVLNQAVSFKTGFGARLFPERDSDQRS